MKSGFFSKLMSLVTVTMLATAAYAAGAVHKGSLQVADAVQVNGKQLPPGDYTVTWEGEGPNVDLHFTKGNREMATAQATVVALDKKASDDAAETSKGSSGMRELTALRFAGRKYELDVVNSGSARASDGAK